MTRNKYNARKVVIDGIHFASRAEGNRYLYLKSRLQSGEISDLQCHPRYKLLNGVTWNGKRYRPASYTADFQYREGDKMVCEEVKGGKATQTTAFVLRMKMWIALHDEDEWDYRIVEV